MTLRRRALPLLALATFLTLSILYLTTTEWRALPQHIGLGDHLSSTPQSPDYTTWNPRPAFNPGSTLDASHNLSATLVIARTAKDDMSWLDSELPGWDTAIYTVDDPGAGDLHPPKNKGHEVMVYLSYIIAYYDTLPDVVLFMHAHQLAWHNDDLLGHSAVNMVSRLSLPRVWREGFVNLRCSWFPGCPDWMHPGAVEVDIYKQEEVLLAKSWAELFPLDPIPETLAQPCCAQFALSRERVQARSRAQYVWYRDWLMQTRIPDHLSGRVWEYVWQFVFTGESVKCPAESMCFCEQYGACFGGEDQYSQFRVLKNELLGKEGELRDWEERRDKIDKAKKEGDKKTLDEIETPEPGKDARLKLEIDRLKPNVERLIREAEERGRDPKNRALEAGREWNEGDGF